MLLQLPREILEYILSIVVYDYCVGERVRTGTGLRYEKTHTSVVVEENIALMTLHGGSFYCEYHESNRSILMRRLSFVHPKLRKILLDVSIKRGKNFDKNVWSFDERFFHTLSSHSLANGNI